MTKNPESRSSIRDTQPRRILCEKLELVIMLNLRDQRELESAWCMRVIYDSLVE